MDLRIRDLVIFLRTYFPQDLPVMRAVYAIVFTVSLWPIVALHRNQIRHRRQNETAWTSALKDLVEHAMQPNGHQPASTIPPSWTEEEPQELEGLINRWHHDLDDILDFLGVQDATDIHTCLPALPNILCTKHLVCSRCGPDVNNRSLRRITDAQSITLITADLKAKQAYLLAAHCVTCKSNYYPDRITYMGPDGKRQQLLECKTEYLRVSKRGVWVERKLALMQEQSILQHRSGWAKCSAWVEGVSGLRELTVERSQRLFLEHFARRLLVAHQLEDRFICHADPKAKILRQLFDLYWALTAV